MIHSRSPLHREVNGLKKFAQIVRIKRRESGESLRHAATLIGVSHSTLSRIERGLDMSVVSFALVCVHFRLKPEVFLRLVVQQRI